MNDTRSAEIFLNLVLSVIHPELFESGVLMLRKLQTLDATQTIALEWQSVYTGIQIISNRLTPSHRDSKDNLNGLTFLPVTVAVALPPAFWSMTWD